MKRVVITGMGIYSCIGRNQEEVKESLFQGKSGIGIAPARKEMGYFSALTGLVERPDLKKLLDRKNTPSLALNKYLKILVFYFYYFLRISFEFFPAVFESYFRIHFS